MRESKVDPCPDYPKQMKQDWCGRWSGVEARARDEDLSLGRGKANEYDASVINKPVPEACITLVIYVEITGVGRVKT